MRRATLALCALTAACTTERVVYDAPDATPWGASACDLDGGYAPAPAMAIVTNSGESSVAEIDTAAGTTLRTLEVGVGPLALNGPHHIAARFTEGWLLTPLSFPAPPIVSGPHASHGSATVNGVLVKRSLCDGRLLGRVDVEANPGDVVLTPDGRTALVTHFDLARALTNAGNPMAQRSNLLVIDVATMRVRHRLPLCVAAHGVGVTPDGRTALVACYGDDALGVVDLTSSPPTTALRYLGSPPANPTSPSHGPYSIGMSPDGQTAWVGCSESGVLVAYDIARGSFDSARLTRRLPGKPWFMGFTPDGSRMLVPTQNRDGVVEVSTSAPLAIERAVELTAEQCTLPHQAAWGPDGRWYLVCEGVHGSDASRWTPGTVLAIDPTDLTVRQRWTMGYFPDAILFAQGSP